MSVDVAEFLDLQEAVRQLHDFIINELDPEPAAVEDYISDKGAAAAARRAMEARPLRYFGLVEAQDGEEPPWRT
jgi:hypothetical protein